MNEELSFKDLRGMRVVTNRDFLEYNVKKGTVGTVDDRRKPVWIHGKEEWVFVLWDEVISGWGKHLYLPVYGLTLLNAVFDKEQLVIDRNNIQPGNSESLWKELIG